MCLINTPRDASVLEKFRMSISYKGGVVDLENQLLRTEDVGATPDCVEVHRLCLLPSVTSCILFRMELNETLRRSLHIAKFGI